MKKKIIPLIFLITILCVNVYAFDYILYDNMNGASINTTLWTSATCSLNTSIAYEGNGSIMCTGTNQITSKIMNESITTNGKYIISYWAGGYSPTWNDAIQPSIQSNTGTIATFIQAGYPLAGYHSRGEWTSNNISSNSGAYSMDGVWLNFKFLVDNDNALWGIYYCNTTGSCTQGNFTSNYSMMNGVTDVQRMAYTPTASETMWIDKVEIWNYTKYGWTAPTGVTNYTITAQQTNGTIINNFNATITNGGTSYYGTTTGTIITDKLSNSTTLYNVTINSTGYITTTYNNENASVNRLSNLTKNSISLLLNYPINNYHTNEQPIPISYNITTNNTITCDLNINGVKNVTNTSLTTGKITINKNLTDGTYNYSVNCTDGLNTNTTSVYNFTIDTNTPVWTIRSISTSNITKIDREQTPWIYINDTITDTNLFMYNLTVYYPNGTVWFSNSTFNTTLTQINVTRNQTIVSTQPNGTYSINYYAEDDHTALSIPDYQVELPKQDDLIKDIQFNTTAKINIIPETDVLTADIIKQVDRYNFEFTYPTTKQTRIYHVTSDKPIYLRNKYSFPSFVTGKNWIDFNTETQGKTYIITKISDYDYQISITDSKIIEVPVEEEILFKSLGGLNIVNNTYTFQIKVNNAPVIQNITPITNITTTENSYLNFTTYATDSDNDTIIYTYNYDGTLIYTGQNLTNYYLNYSTSGNHQITVYATDGGKTSNYTWYITVSNVNLPPTITTMSYTPLSNWYANLNNTYATCTGYDTDNETNQTSLNYTIDYTTDGSTWNSLTPVYDSGNTWKALINVTSLQDETLSTRCRINDGTNTTAYSYLNNFITVQPEYILISDVNIIKPNSGVYDFVIPVTCTPTTYGTISSNQYTYDIDYNTGGVWYNLSNNYFNKALFDMAIINYTQNVSFRCAIYDGITTTAYTQTNNITRQHITNLFMFNKGNDEVQRANQIYYKGLYADFYNEAGVSIISSYIDCNGDDFWDYYYTYTDIRNTTTENFACYNTKGLVKHTVGVFINKSDASNRFCGVGTLGICKIERSYDVLVK